MIDRRLQEQLIHLLQHYPAVALLGPRQVGKTTLALAAASSISSIYLDLESDAGRAKLTDPELYLADHIDELVILDEVQRLPGIFQNLRGIIDQGRRSGAGEGRFLLLGSASIELLQQSSETLAGRIAYLELTPLDVLEVEQAEIDDLWVRGGFPDSFLAADDDLSLRWRQDFIRTYLERDVPMLGSRIPAETLRRFWGMLAHTQGGLLNAASLARSLRVDGKTVAKYLDLMVDLLLVRRLQPWHRNVGKRLVKSPRVYIRDSGITHALLGLKNKEELVGHPVVGASWEAYIMENLIVVAPEGTEPYFYRTAAGAEIDLVLTLPGNRICAVEIKRNLNPKPTKGFCQACEDLGADYRFVVYPGVDQFSVSAGVTAINVIELSRMISRGLK
ncbi:MAG: ATP-binding protein [Gammaproteobacteria bacterium]|nr:ATP-binding protein [Gammaproteobacteria bacterium]